jgi:hypothetical protein
LIRNLKLLDEGIELHLVQEFPKVTSQVLLDKYDMVVVFVELQRPQPVYNRDQLYLLDFQKVLEDKAIHQCTVDHHRVSEMLHNFLPLLIALIRLLFVVSILFY